MGLTPADASCRNGPAVCSSRNGRESEVGASHGLQMLPSNDPNFTARYWSRVHTNGNKVRRPSKGDALCSLRRRCRRLLLHFLQSRLQILFAHKADPLAQDRALPIE